MNQPHWLHFTSIESIVQRSYNSLTRYFHIHAVLAAIEGMFQALCHSTRAYALFQDLVKHTWHDHQDFTTLTQALAKMDETTSYLNEAQRDAENLNDVSAISAKVSGVDNLVLPHRRRT